MADTAPTKPTDAGPETDLSGRDLGDFHLLRRLGRGAMAEVYLAEQGSLRRQVAIKVLKPNLACDEVYVRRFHNEAQAAASLVHANIVQIHEVGCKEGVHFIAQEYVAGQNLHELLARSGTLDVRVAVTIIRQVALALDKAAAQGIVHRDIKPDNIMLARNGEVKVADFGLARLSGDSADLKLTQIGVTMGTPLYMSPEQVEGRPLDPRSDIYSFGVTCFHMLAGRPPFEGETALSVAIQHLKSPPPRLEQLRPDLPPGLCRIVHRMLAKEVAERYGSARELLRDLRALHVEGVEDEWWEHVTAADGIDLAAATGRVAATQQLAAVMKTQALVARQRGRKRTRWIAGLAAAFIFGGVAAWLVREPFLLAEAHGPTVVKHDSARAQFASARLQLSDREAWLKSVAAYFPADRVWVPRAQEELYWLYLQQNRLDEALGVAESLTRLTDETEAEFRDFGLAGQSVVLTMQGKHDRAAQALAQLDPLKQRLSQQMRQQLLFVFKENQRLLQGSDKQTAQQWDEWRRKQAAEGTPDGG